METEALNSEQTIRLIDALIERIPRGKFSDVVGILMGGVPVSTEIARVLGLPHHSVLISCYDDKRRKREKPICLQDRFRTLDHRRCLIVDDLVDTGDTIQLFKEKFGFRKDHDAIATLFWKTDATVKPDFFVCVRHPRTWITFPWEL